MHQWQSNSNIDTRNAKNAWNNPPQDTVKRTEEQRSMQRMARLPPALIILQASQVLTHIHVDSDKFPLLPHELGIHNDTM